MKIASLLTEFQSIEIKTKTAEINGKPYSIADGETVLSFIRRHLGKNYVPTLCDAPNLEAFGSCRVCSVEVGRPGNGADPRELQ